MSRNRPQSRELQEGVATVSEPELLRAFPALITDLSSDRENSLSLVRKLAIGRRLKGADAKIDYLFNDVLPWVQGLLERMVVIDASTHYAAEEALSGSVLDPADANNMVAAITDGLAAVNHLETKEPMLSDEGKAALNALKQALLYLDDTIGRYSDDDEDDDGEGEDEEGGPGGDGGGSAGGGSAAGEAGR